MTYISPEETIPIICKKGTTFHYQIKSVIIGYKVDWWTPVKILYSHKIDKTQRASDLVELEINTDSIKNTELYLTKIDQKTIRNYLKNNKKEI
jgi:hypothetical protein